MQKITKQIKRPGPKLGRTPRPVKGGATSSPRMSVDLTEGRATTVREKRTERLKQIKFQNKKSQTGYGLTMFLRNPICPDGLTKN